VGKYQRFDGAVRITGEQHESAPMLGSQAHGRTGVSGSSKQNIVEHYILRPGVCRSKSKKRAIGGVMRRCLTVRCPEKEAGFAVFRA
jgi:hypothetical protein